MSRRREQPLEHRLLLTATFCLLAGGAVMVYSASSARTLLEGQGDGTMYLVKYLAYGSMGLIVMHLLSRHGLEHVRPGVRYPAVLLTAGINDSRVEAWQPAKMTAVLQERSAGGPALFRVGFDGGARDGADEGSASRGDG